MTVELEITPVIAELTVEGVEVDLTVEQAIVELEVGTEIVDLTVEMAIVDLEVENKIVEVFTVGMQGPQGIRGPTGPSGSGGFNLTAGETINANMPIKVNADGFAYIASNLVGIDAGNVVGISQTSALIGESITVSRGELHNISWTWMTGAIYIGDRTLTQTPPATGFLQIIATAISPQDIVGTLLQPFALTA